jgi:Uma2 family endonuclease
MEPRRISFVKSVVQELRHVRPVQPLVFGSANPEWQLGQSLRHLHLCELLHAILRQAVTRDDSIGSDQFVYFDAGNPKKCVAPDGFVKRAVLQRMFTSWKTWEHGAPELCVEILSPSDEEPITLAEKLDRYRALGAKEVVVFNIDEPAARLRVSDRIDDDLVERVVVGDATPCVTLGLHWVLATAPDLPVALRLSRDDEGANLVLTPEESERAAKESERAAKEEAIQELARLRAELDSLRR